jgi:hypothetical protein
MKRTDRAPSPGALYLTLDRLEEKADYEFPIVILVLIDFLISGALVAGVLEGHREMRAQLS